VTNNAGYEPSVIANLTDYVQVPLVEELTPTPEIWEAFQRLAPRAHVLFLDSALSHPELGRYSFLTADPFAWVRSRGKHVSVAGVPQPRENDNPFTVLAELLECYRLESIAGLPPFQGGAAGLFGYDLCHHLERLPRPRWDDFEVPDLAVGFYDWVLGFDHLAGSAWLISTGLPETEPRRRRRRAEMRLRQVRQWLRFPLLPPPRVSTIISTPFAPQWPVPGRQNLSSNFSREAYLTTIRRAIEYVHAGDCFQVNIAQRLLSPAVLAGPTIYRRLRQRNCAPFAGYFDLGDFVVASASPERFLRLGYGGPSNGKAHPPDDVEARPIKGTRPRGSTSAADQARVAELEASAKDRAENIMIVDLLRNDLGRVCRYGSISVPSVCRVESYRYVHHLVSQVRGRMRPGLGSVDLLRAAFPGGSVTGAPKIRAMEIIAELEPTARGPYCGSLGYLGFDGSMDTNILIRTFTIGKGWIQFPVGGGIVADSDPRTEYDETWHKAEGMLRALEESS
jgi:para-aminobenzoate synthetase component 1